MTARWLCFSAIWLGVLGAWGAEAARGQITSIPPITDVPTYGTPSRGQLPPWRRGGGLFGRRRAATTGVPSTVTPATVPPSCNGPVVVSPGTTCAWPSGTVVPGTVPSAPSAPPASSWQPVPSTPAPTGPSPSAPAAPPATQPAPPPATTIPAAPTSVSGTPVGSGVSAQRVIQYYAGPPVVYGGYPAAGYTVPSSPGWAGR